jgi:hypothetical protein
MHFIPSSIDASFFLVFALFACLHFASFYSYCLYSDPRLLPPVCCICLIVLPSSRVSRPSSPHQYSLVKVHVSIFESVLMYMCVCVCVCVYVR